MTKKKAKRLKIFGAVALAFVGFYYYVVVQARAAVLRHMISDRDVVYVIEGSLPGTFRALGDTGCTVVTHMEHVPPTPGGNFYARDGRQIIYLHAGMVYPFGWRTFAVSSDWIGGGLYGGGGWNIVTWDSDGWHWESGTTTWVSLRGGAVDLKVEYTDAPRPKRHARAESLVGTS